MLSKNVCIFLCFSVLNNENIQRSGHLVSDDIISIDVIARKEKQTVNIQDVKKK